MTNSETNKRIAKNTIMLYFRMFVTMAVSLYTSRVIINTLGIQDFGIYNVVGGIVAMFAFLNGTMATGTQRFLTFQIGKNDLEELKKTFSASLLIHTFLAIIILILAETIGIWFLNNKMNIPIERMTAARWVYQFSVFASIISILQVPYNATIIAHERMNVYAYVSIIEVSLKLIIVYLIVVSKYDKLITYSILIFIVNIIVILIYRNYCQRKYEESKFQFVWDKNLYKALLEFSGWNLFGCLAFTSANEGINILLNIFFGPVVNAARAISFQVNNAINGFINNFQTAVNPQIVKLYANGNIKELNKLIFQNSKYALLLMLFIALPLMYELKIILHLWLKIVPENTVLFCRLILIQSLIYSFLRPYVMAIHATGKMKVLNLSVGIVLLMILPISYLLLKLGYPSYSPFLIYIVTSSIELCIEVFLLTKMINLPINLFFKESVFPIFKVLIISQLIPLILYNKMSDGIERFFLISIISCLSIILSSYFFAIDTETRNMIKAKINSNIHF